MEVLAGLTTLTGLCIALWLCQPPYYITVVILFATISCIILERRRVNKHIMETELGWKLREGVSKGLYSVVLIPSSIILSTLYNKEQLQDDFSKMLLLMSLAAILCPLVVLSYTLLLTAQKIEYDDCKHKDKPTESGPTECGDGPAVSAAPAPAAPAAAPVIELERTPVTVLHVAHLVGAVALGFFLLMVSLNTLGFKPTVLMVMHTLLLSIIQTTLPVLMPRSFGLGEAAVVAQALTYFQLVLAAQLWFKFEWLKINSTMLSSVRDITAFTEVAMLSCLLVVVVLLFRPAWRTSARFYLLVPGVMLGFSLPALYLVLHADFVSWIVRYIGRSAAKRYLFFYWAIATVLSILSVYFNARFLRQHEEASKPVYHLPAKIRNRIRASQSNGTHAASHERRNSTSEKAAAETLRVKSDMAKKTRKQFHVLTLAVFLPGLVVDPEVTAAAWSCALIVFIMLECLRIVGVYPWGCYLEEYLSVFRDDRDQGPVILTPIYLLTGCTLPLWLYPRSGSHLCLFSGVLSLGIGDTAASVVGTWIGRHKWPDSQKSVEGTLASIFCQLVFMWAFSYTVWCPAFTWPGLVTAVTLTSLLEATTSQIDNLVLPLLMYVLTVS